MTLDLNSPQRLNRRSALRIWEEADLFYQPIAKSVDYVSTVSDTQPLEFSVSRAQEQDTLHINISHTGIAFTCREPLHPGDYLLVRVLLLSSMTSLISACQVVYCKPSNPYERNRYPYQVGARFINLSSRDSAVLEQHIRKRNFQHNLLMALTAIPLLLALLAPDLAWHFLVQALHHLFASLGHLIYLLFEFVEYSLDHLIEHLFHTDLHTTQLIVFYLLAILSMLIVYLLWRSVPPLCQRWAGAAQAYWYRKTASIGYYWKQQTLARKTYMIASSMAAISLYLFLAF